MKSVVVIISVVIFLSIFVFHKPAVGELIGGQGQDRQEERREHQWLRSILETTESQSDTEGDATLPPEHKRTLRRAALTVPAQLDEE